MGHQHRTGCTTEECLKRGQEPAPVDTVRLKSDIFNYNFHKIMADDIVRNPKNSEAYGEISNKSIVSMAKRNREDNRKKEMAARDTLDKARKGKIKAK